jgi:hypothetical protein
VDQTVSPKSECSISMHVIGRCNFGQKTATLGADALRPKTFARKPSGRSTLDTDAAQNQLHGCRVHLGAMQHDIAWPKHLW